MAHTLTIHAGANSVVVEDLLDVWIIECSFWPGEYALRYADRLHKSNLICLAINREELQSAKKKILAAYKNGLERVYV